MYLRAAETELEAAGESTDGMASSVSELREELLALTGGAVDIQIDEDTFKGTYEIMQELSQVWEDLSDVSQANIVELIGGKRNSNVVTALLENFDVAEEALATAADSAGSALAENEVYLDSIEGKVAQLQAAFEALSASVVNSDFIKDVVDFGTNLVEGINSMASSAGSLGTILSTITAAIAAINTLKGKDSIFSMLKVDEGELTVSKNAITNFFDTFEQLHSSGMKTSEAFASSITGSYKTAALQIQAYNYSLKGSATAQETFMNNLQKENSVLYQYVASLNGASASLTGFVTWLKASGIQMDATTIKAAALKVAFQGLALIGNMFIAVVASLALSKLTEMFTSWANAADEAREAAEEAYDAYSEGAETVEDYKTQIQELRDEIDSGTLSEEETVEARKELLSIQDEIVENLGAEAGAFNVLKDSIDEINSVLDTYTKSDATKTLTENQDAYDKAIKQMEKLRSYTGNLFDEVTGDNTVANQVKEIFESVFGDNVSFETTSYGLERFKLTGVTAEEASEGITKVNEALYELDAQLGESGIDLTEALGLDRFDETWEGSLSSVLSDAQETLDEFQELYEEQIQLKIVANPDYSSIMNSVSDISDAYNDAIAAGDLEGAQAASANLAQVLLDAENIDDEGVREYITELIIALQEEVSNAEIELEFTLKLKDEDSDLRQKTEDALNVFRDENGEVSEQALLDAQSKYEIESASGVDAYSETGAAIAWLTALAEENGKSLAEYIDYLVEYGLVVGDVAEEAEETTDALTAIQEKLDAVNDAKELANTASDEQYTTGTVSLDTYNSLIEASEAYADCLEENNGRLEFSKEKFDEITQSIMETEQAELELAKSEALAQYEANLERIEELRTTPYYKDYIQEEIAALEEENAVLQESINKYTLLTQEMDYASSGYASWVNSQDSTSSGAMFEDAATAYNSLIEILGSGKVNTDEYKGILDFLIPDSVSDQGQDAIMAYAQDMADLLGEDSEMTLTALQEQLSNLAANGFAKLNEDGSWTLEANLDVSKVAEAMTWTEDFTLAMLGELQEYGDTIYLDVFDLFEERLNSITNASDTLTDAISEQQESGALSLETYEELVALGDEYTDCLVYNGNAMVVDADKASELVKQLNETEKAELEVASAAEEAEWAENAKLILQMEQSYDSLTDAQKDELAALEAENKQIAENINKYQELIAQLDYANSGYKAWLDADSSTDSGTMFDDAIDAYEALNDGLVSLKTDTAEYKAAVDYLIPDDIKEQGTQAVSDYANYYLKPLMQEVEEGETGFDRFSRFLSQSVDAGLMTLEDGSYSFAEGVTLEDFETKLNYTRDALLAIFGELDEYEGWDINFVDNDTEALNTLQDLFDAYSNLHEAQTEYGEDSQEYADAQAQMADVIDAVNNLTDEQMAEIGLTWAEGSDQEEVEDLMVNGMEIDAAVDLTTSKNDVEQAVEDYMTAYRALQEGIESGADLTQLDADLKSARTKLESFDDSVKLEYGIDDSLFDYGIASLTEALEDYQVAVQTSAETTDEDVKGEAEDTIKYLESVFGSIDNFELLTGLNLDTLREDIENGVIDVGELEIPVSLDESQLETLEKIVELADGDYELNIDSTQALESMEAVATKKAEIEEPVVLTADTAAAQEALDSLYEVYEKLVNKTMKITVNVIGLSNVKTLSSLVSALKSKTITVTTNTVTSGDSTSGETHSMASGTAGAEKTMTALMGELGREIVVDPKSGTWYTVGDNGPEFHKITKGQIVFNAAQTEDLLNKGWTPTRGTALVGGTALTTGINAGGSDMTAWSNKSSYGSSSSSSSSSSTEDEIEEMLDEIREELDEFIDSITHEIFMSERNGGTTEEIVSYYQSIMDQLHQTAETYRSLELEEAESYINQLEEEWWEYYDTVEELMIESYETQRSELENSVTLLSNWYDSAISNGEYTKAEAYSQRMVQALREQQAVLHEQAEFLRSRGYSDTSDEVSELSDLWWDLEEDISEAMEMVEESYNEMLSTLSDGVDELQNVYDTLLDAASEYASSGFITVDTLQEILDLGANYLSLLIDENGQLVINKESIEALIAAKTQELGVTTAISYAEQVVAAQRDGDIEKLNELLYATEATTESTYELAYALIQTSDLASDQKEAAYKVINAIRSLSDSAVTSIGQDTDALSDQLEEMETGINDLIDYVMD